MNYNPSNVNLTVITSEKIKRLMKLKRPQTFERVKLTPTLAQVILEANTENRSTTISTVVSYREAMLRGAWFYGGASTGMCISSDGVCRNGGHRCESLVAAGKVDPNAFIVIDITFGVEPEVGKVIDQNRVRSGGDVFEMFHSLPKGEAKATAAICRTLWVHMNNNHRQKMAPDLLESLYADFSKGFEIVDFLTTNNLKVSHRAAAFVLVAQSHFEDVKRFLEAEKLGLTGKFPGGAKLSAYINSPGKNDPVDLQFRKILYGLKMFIAKEERSKLDSSKQTLTSFAAAAAKGKRLTSGGVLKTFLEKERESELVLK